MPRGRSLCLWIVALMFVPGTATLSARRPDHVPSRPADRYERLEALVAECEALAEAAGCGDEAAQRAARRVLPLVRAAALPGRGMTAPDEVVIDRSFLRDWPEQPTFDDLEEHYYELQYLSNCRDPAARRALLRMIGCGRMPDQNVRDVMVAAYDKWTGIEGDFWGALPDFSPEAQFRIICYFNGVYDSDFGHVEGLMADYEGDRDDYLAAHPDVQSLLADAPTAE